MEKCSHHSTEFLDTWELPNLDGREGGGAEAMVVGGLQRHEGELRPIGAEGEGGLRITRRTEILDLLLQIPQPEVK